MTKENKIKEFETWMLMNEPNTNEILDFAEGIFDEGYKTQWLPNYEKAFKEEIGKEYFKNGYEMGKKVYKDICAEERNKTFIEILKLLEDYLPDVWHSEQTGVEKAIRLIEKNK